MINSISAIAEGAGVNENKCLGHCCHYSKTFLRELIYQILLAVTLPMLMQCRCHIRSEYGFNYRTKQEHSHAIIANDAAILSEASQSMIKVNSVLSLYWFESAFMQMRAASLI